MEEVLNFRIKSPNTPRQIIRQYRVTGKRRLNATEPEEEDLYIDTRNLWKASSVMQLKQYESIRNSGLLDSARQLTFMKFNYRNNQQKSLCYPEVFKPFAHKPEQELSLKKRAVLKKVQHETKEYTQRIPKQLKENAFQVTHDWLEQYHETEREPRTEPNKAYVSLGSMNVNELWGERQLQQSLGFLPCKRDRPKILKLYSKNINNKHIKSLNSARCRTLAS